MKFPEDFFDKMKPKIDKAFGAMLELEAGAIANPTERRMVGHYWLRNPALAPTAEIRKGIEDTIQRIKRFAEDVHAGKITAENGKRFEHVLHIGIGGSALGPQLVADALGSARDRMDIHFFEEILRKFHPADIERKTKITVIQKISLEPLPLRGRSHAIT